jgi:hypothetical protein
LAGFAAKHLTPAGVPPFIGATRAVLIAGILSVCAALLYILKLPALRRIIRPIYVQKGILPQMAQGLAAADQLADAGE